jgi:signal transduction histidine kinase
MRKQRKELELASELAVKEVEREREEQLVQVDKLATMAALATGIAHEVSTPLGVIVGRAEQILPKVSHDERAKRSVESIIDQGTRISRVVRGFLNLARGESPALEHVNPGTVAEAAEELVEHRFEKAGVGLTVRIDRGLPKVACDPRLLEQVLINLLLNACDACEAGGLVELSVRADSQCVGFVVTDDGIGITPEAAARATEPFFTTKPIGQGTGLGLAISAEIVKHHGGNISIAPRGLNGDHGPPYGTRASVELPAVKGIA